MPDYEQPFVVETDASGKGIGAVLMQQGHPIAYISKSLAPRHQAMCVYDRELLALIFAVSKWSHHLLGRNFIVKTDQKALKYLLNQHAHTDFQVACISKLMAFDFCIEYKKGVENKVADALSRKPDAELLAISLRSPHNSLLDQIKASWTTDQSLQGIITKVQTMPYKSFTWHNNQLRWKGRLVVGADYQLRSSIITLWHDSTIGGHSGMDATIKRLQSLFYWKTLVQDVRDYINKCDICQRHKYDAAASPGLIQPLPVPEGVWTDICLDFIEVLPKSTGKEVILVVVDRLSKYGHFMALSHPYTAQSVAQCFLNNIFKLHGMPNTMTSDRDPIFLSNFWEELFSLQGVQLQRSTAYHPQTDGQTEVLNRTLETYLRCFCSDKPKEWCSYLPLAEWWYNTTYHSTIKCTPYEVLYGQKPPVHLSYLAGEASIEMVDRPLAARESIIQLLKFHILRAQQRMRDTANKHRSDRSFEVGEWVYLKLQPYRQVSLAVRTFPKLAAKYYGPYLIDAKIGAVAYRLLLPADVLIHPTFHVSQLKRCIEVPSIINHPSVLHLSSPYCPSPEAVLDRRLVKRGNRAVGQVLVKWSGIDDTQATWEFDSELQHRFPAFHP